MDAILTFVLVIASVKYGQPVTTVQGYTSLAACERAAQAYADGFKKIGPYGGSYSFCIPGPERRP
jgi:hypothetical protein